MKYNLEQVSRGLAGGPIVAVIKNNGCGLGPVNVARVLESQPQVEAWAVVKLHEAHTLLDAEIRKPVLCMGPFSEREL